MAEYSVWLDSQTADSPDNSDGGAAGIVLGTGLLFGAAMVAVTHIRFLATTTVSGTYTVALYEMDTAATGTLLASKTVDAGDLDAGAWNRVALDDSVLVDAATAYKAVVWSSAGRYPATLNHFATAKGDLAEVFAWADNEDISSIVPAISTVDQGTFAANSALTFPTVESNRASYFVDVVAVDELPASGGSAMLAFFGAD